MKYRERMITEAFAETCGLFLQVKQGEVRDPQVLEAAEELYRVAKSAGYGYDHVTEGLAVHTLRHLAVLGPHRRLGFVLDRVTVCREHDLDSGARLLVYGSSAPGRGHRAAEILLSEKCSVEEALRRTHQEEDAAVAAAIVQAIISRYGFAGERVPVWMREEMDRLDTIDPFSSDDPRFITN